MTSGRTSAFDFFEVFFSSTAERPSGLGSREVSHSILIERNQHDDDEDCIRIVPQCHCERAGLHDERGDAQDAPLQ